MRDSGYGENWDPDKEELFSSQQPNYRREDSVESIDSVGSRTLSVASDYTLIAGSEGRYDSEGCIYVLLYSLCLSTFKFYCD